MIQAKMLPLAEFPATAARRVVAVLTDIDDTLTVDGRLPALAYAGLERLHAAGLVVVPVTGRPAGWCDLIARQWPVDAVVGENGAFWFRYEDDRRRMVRRFVRSAEERAADRVKLDAIRRDVLAEVPGAALSADQGFREADLAIDYCEDVPPLPAKAVERIVGVFHAHGATAKVSSIHVNGWFGHYDKLSTSLGLLSEVFGIDAAAQPERVVFVGDSPNDAPMFAHFPNAVGVANVVDFAPSMPALPGYVAHGRSAAGFAEVADMLLRNR
jgi:HAD superfamily hydrolase (TIGR01484 family)